MPIVITGEKQLLKKRQSMVVYRAAMMSALALIPVVDSNALVIANSIADHPDFPLLGKIAWHEVIQFERTHPDIDRWAPILIGMIKTTENSDDLIIDSIFELAIAIEQSTESVINEALIKVTTLIGV